MQALLKLHPRTGQFSPNLRPYIGHFPSTLRYPSQSAAQYPPSPSPHVLQDSQLLGKVPTTLPLLLE